MCVAYSLLFSKILYFFEFPSQSHATAFQNFTVPEVKNFITPGKPYLLNYCIECDEIWLGNVFLGVLPLLRFWMWSEELFLQLLNVTFFSQSDHTIGFCEKFPWIWKKNQLSTTNGSEVMAVWSFRSRKGLEGYILIVQKNYYEKHLT